MSNVDMCEHDWPGTGCRECMREAHKAKISTLEDRILGEIESKMLAEAELHEAAENALKADARIEELENMIHQLLYTSRPVATCAYNIGHSHEDWRNIHEYISSLDQTRNEAIKLLKENN